MIVSCACSTRGHHASLATYRAAGSFDCGYTGLHRLQPLRPRLLRRSFYCITDSSTIQWLTHPPSHRQIDSGSVRPLHRRRTRLTCRRWFTRSHPSFADASDLVQEATLWGKGHEGYDAHFSLRDNLISRFGRADHFDAILPYWNGDQTNHLGLDPAPYFYSIAEVSRSGRGAVVIDRPHEMRDGRRIPMLGLANITLFLAPCTSVLPLWISRSS